MYLDFAAIKAAVSFADAISKLRLEVKAHGSQWRGVCPACNTGGDRALVITEGKAFYCFASTKGGDVISLVAHIQGVSIKEAAQFLAKPEPRTSTSTSTSSQKPCQEPRKQPTTGFDRAKYQAGLDREHQLLQDVPRDLAARADIGVSGRGTHRGLISVPLYDKDTGEFLGYAGVPSIQLPSKLKPAETLPPNVTRLHKKAS